MDLRKIMITAILAICVFSLSYGIYSQVFEKDYAMADEYEIKPISSEIIEFDKLFDNSINYQDYENKTFTRVDASKELVYTGYKFKETLENKYKIDVSIPTINVKHQNVEKINNEIIEIFQKKVNSIMIEADNEDSLNNIYTVEYTAYLNEDILSVVIKATLKGGNNRKFNS